MTSKRVFKNIDNAVNAPIDADYDGDHRYIMGVDFGKVQDYTVMVVIDTNTQMMVALERFNHINWKDQRERLTTLNQKWQPATIWITQNGMGDAIIEDLAMVDLPVRPFMVTVRSKSAIIEALADAIDNGDITLMPDKNLIHELNVYTIEMQESGHYRYSAPVGEHDDTVIATALSWYAARFGGIRLDFA